VSSSHKKILNKNKNNEIYTKFVALKVEGPNHDFFLEIYPMIRVYDMYAQSLPNLSSRVMHIRDMIKWEKNITQVGHANSNICATN
jgi:hypothetical protein